MSSTFEDVMVVPMLTAAPTAPTMAEDEVIAEATESDPVHTPTDLPAPAETTSSAAARLLEIAARNADQLLNEAQAESDAMRASAREESDELLAAARAEAEEVRSELEESRREAKAEIAELRETERAHRDRMREHLHEVLAKVEATTVV